MTAEQKRPLTFFFHFLQVVHVVDPASERIQVVLLQQRIAQTQVEEAVQVGALRARRAHNRVVGSLEKNKRKEKENVRESERERESLLRFAQVPLTNSHESEKMMMC